MRIALQGAACCPECVIEFARRCGAWRDVVQKARHIRAAGRVQIHYADKMYAEATVEGDHGKYAVKLYRQDPDSVRITSALCECKWGQWQYRRRHEYVGRVCSHQLATFWELRAQDLRRVPKDYNSPKSVQHLLPIPRRPGQ